MNCCQTFLRCVFQNFILRVQRTFLRKNTFEIDEIVVLCVPWANHFGHLGWNFYGVKKNYYTVFENAIPVSWETNWEIFLGKVLDFQSSQYFDQNFFGFREKNLRPGLSKFHSASPDEGFEDFVFEKTMIFFNLCTLSGKVSHFCKTFTARFPKHQSKRPGKLFAKSFFFKTDGIIFFPFFERKTEEVG